MNLSIAARLLSIVLAACLACSTVHADETNGLRSSVAPVGDLDGDGVPDFALAQRPAVRTNGWPKTELVLVRILSGRNGDRIRTLLAPMECVDFGRALADVGDVDGDGLRDLAIAGGGRVWVFSGEDGRVIYELGKEHTSRGFGQSIASGWDVDGDGVSDIAVGVFRRPFSQSHVEDLVLLYSGRSGALIQAIGCRPSPERPAYVDKERYTRAPGSSFAGAAIALVPDRTGDDRAELALTLERADLGESDRQCATLVVIDPVNARTLQVSRLPERKSGGGPWVIQSLGDLDDDGVDELAVSLVHDYLVVYRGGSGEELRRRSFVGYYMMAEGTSLDAIGDVNGDGVPDYVLGANEDSLDCDPGFAIVYSGKDGVPLRNLVFNGYDDNECGTGVDVCTLGDTNGDGVDDVVVHMPRLREARVLSGADFSVLVNVDIAELEVEELRNR